MRNDSLLFNSAELSLWSYISIQYTALNLPSHFFPYRDLKLICQVLNSPALQLCYIILYMSFKQPSFELTLRSENGNKIEAKFSLHTVHIYM